MANKDYLDKTGLLYFWGRVKDWIVSKHYVSADAQALTSEQKAQVRTNIGAQAELTFDNTPTQNSNNPVKSGGVYTAIDAKYTKPVTGIPAEDLSTAVQTSLGKADTALQEHQDISGKVDKITGMGLSSNDFTTAEKEKLAGIDNQANKYVLPAATSNALGGVQIGSNIGNNNGLISVADASSGTKGVVQLSTDISTDSASDAKAATPKAVASYVATQVSSVFSFGGSTTFANLPPTPSAANVNKIYNISDAFTTTSSFVEGAGKSYPAGTNIIVVDISGTPMYDVTTGFYDLSPYALEAEFIAITNAEIEAIVV